ncbi:hypothetical protein TRFO_22357 [Tritrichomonas foetus]|uniref:Uncharacterized protein n=1 Tax=Tritrichomonas foetus TaxID=1144522 RepID=A0A1J4KCJ7_9EUKA|nr:hypothetical protein TRFO_22357 [Tritrichomonas foetus]|eukprot:OHT08939.1 hypothetical protein TRFO_22357 [Tritrichomonas foetus]
MFSFLLFASSFSQKIFFACGTEKHMKEFYYRVKSGSSYSDEIKCQVDSLTKRELDANLNDIIQVKNAEIDTCTEWTDVQTVNKIPSESDLLNYILISTGMFNPNGKQQCRYTYSVEMTNRLRGYTVEYQNHTTAKFESFPYRSTKLLSEKSDSTGYFSLKITNSELSGCSGVSHNYEVTDHYKTKFDLTRTYLNKNIMLKKCYLEPEYIVRAKNSLPSPYTVEYLDAGSYKEIAQGGYQEFAEKSSFTQSFYISNSNLQSCTRVQISTTAQNEDTSFSVYDITKDMIPSGSCTETQQYYVDIENNVNLAGVTITAYVDGTQIPLPVHQTKSTEFTVELKATAEGNNECQAITLLNNKGSITSKTYRDTVTIVNSDVPPVCHPQEATYYLELDNRIDIENAVLSYTLNGETKTLNSGLNSLTSENAISITVIISIPGKCSNAVVQTYQFSANQDHEYAITNDDVPSECKENPDQSSYCYCVPTCPFPDESCQEKTFTEITAELRDQTIDDLMILMNGEGNLNDLDISVRNSIIINASSSSAKLTGTLKSRNVDTKVSILSYDSSTMNEVTLDLKHSGQLFNGNEFPISMKSKVPPCLMNERVNSLNIDFGDLEKDGEYIPAYVSTSPINNLRFTSTKGTFDYASVQTDVVEFAESLRLKGRKQSNQMRKREAPLLIYKYKFVKEDGGDQPIPPPSDDDKPDPPEELPDVNGCIGSCLGQESTTLEKISQNYKGKTIGSLQLIFHGDFNLNDLQVDVKESIMLMSLSGKMTGKLTSQNVDTLIMIGADNGTIEDISIEAINSGIAKKYEISAINEEIPPIALMSKISSLKIDFGDLEKDGEYIPAYVSIEEITNLDFKTTKGEFTLKDPQKVEVTFSKRSKLLEEGGTEDKFYIYQYKLDKKSDSNNTGMIVGIVVAVVVVIVIVVVVVIVLKKRKSKHDSSSSK